jgi:peptidoglycan-N-acetylmuramic acid deacetylase
MASSRWTVRARTETHWRRHGAAFSLIAVILCLSNSDVWASDPIKPPPASCQKRIYLSFDTGHMGVADLIAGVLKETGVRVTFFAANERTQQGDGSLGDHWAPWWKARAAEGHQFASHTFDHVYWRGDLPGGRFKVRPSAGPKQGKTMEWDAGQYCAEIKRAEERLRAITGQAPLPLYRAPGGKTSKALVEAAAACGYAHVGWSKAGFLGDELPSERFPNKALLEQALKGIRADDILVAHLGIWSRKDPWAPAVLKPLIEGLQAKGFCFDTLDHHPRYREWTRRHLAGMKPPGATQ